MITRGRRRSLLGISVAVIAAAGLVGCDRLWDAVNRRSAMSDVRAVLSSSGVGTETLSCRSLPASRDVECRLKGGPAEVQRLAKALSLTPVEAGTADALGSFVEQHRPRGLPPLPTSAAVFAATGRPGVLRLANGSAFEFLLLFRDPASDTLWLRLSYSYG